MESVYILHQHPYQNSSAILRLFSHQRGLISAIAKGAKRSKSTTQGLLQAFLPLRVELYGQGDLLRLKSAELIHPSDKLKQKPMLAGLYLNELLLKFLVPNEPHYRLFQCYQQTLMHLNHQSLSLLLRRFEWQLFNSLGLAPDLSHDQRGEPIETDCFYQLIPEHAPIKTTVTSRGHTYPGWLLMAIHRRQWENTAVLKHCQPLFRHWINYYNHGSALKTPNFYKHIIGRKVN